MDTATVTMVLIVAGFMWIKFNSLWKRAGVAACLQRDYGFGDGIARTSVTSSKKLPRKWNKHEKAAWIAVAEVGPNGIKENDMEFLLSCNRIISSKSRRRDIGFRFLTEIQKTISGLQSDHLGEPGSETGIPLTANQEIL